MPWTGEVPSAIVAAVRQQEEKFLAGDNGRYIQVTGIGVIGSGFVWGFDGPTRDLLTIRPD